MRLSDVLLIFPFTTSETMGDCYLKTWYIWVASRVAERLKTSGLKKLGNIRKVSKTHWMTAQRPAPPPKSKPHQCWQKTAENQKLNFTRCALFRTKTRASAKYPASHCRPNININAHFQPPRRCMQHSNCYSNVIS